MSEIPCKKCLCISICKNKKFLDLINQCELLPVFLLSNIESSSIKINAAEANNGYMYLSCSNKDVSECLNKVKKILKSPMFEADDETRQPLTMKMIFFTIRKRLLK